MIKLELSTKRSEDGVGSSDALMLVYALMSLRSDLFKTWNENDDDEKREIYHEMVQDMRVLTRIQSELALHLALTLEGNKRESTIQPAKS